MSAPATDRPFTAARAAKMGNHLAALLYAVESQGGDLQDTEALDRMHWLAGLALELAKDLAQGLDELALRALREGLRP